jgi:hypothetical protein
MKLTESKLREIIKEEIQKLKENSAYLPLKSNRYFYNKRDDKTLKIVSVDGDDIGVQYYDYKTKKPTGKQVHYNKSEVDYWIKKGAWSVYKQKF